MVCTVIVQRHLQAGCGLQAWYCSKGDMEGGHGRVTVDGDRGRGHGSILL